MRKRKEMREYLGDGVYASFDSLDVCIYCERDGETHEVVLTRETLAAFLDFVSRIDQQEDEEA